MSINSRENCRIKIRIDKQLVEEVSEFRAVSYQRMDTVKRKFIAE